MVAYCALRSSAKSRYSLSLRSSAANGEPCSARPTPAPRAPPSPSACFSAAAAAASAAASSSFAPMRRAPERLSTFAAPSCPSASAAANTRASARFAAGSRARGHFRLAPSATPQQQERRARR